MPNTDKKKLSILSKRSIFFGESRETRNRNITFGAKEECRLTQMDECVNKQ